MFHGERLQKKFARVGPSTAFLRHIQWRRGLWSIPIFQRTNAERERYERCGHDIHWTCAFPPSRPLPCDTNAIRWMFGVIRTPSVLRKIGVYSMLRQTADYADPSSGLVTGHCHPRADEYKVLHVFRNGYRLVLFYPT